MWLEMQDMSLAANSCFGAAWMLPFSSVKIIRDVPVPYPSLSNLTVSEAMSICNMDARHPLRQGEVLQRFLMSLLNQCRRQFFPSNKFSTIFMYKQPVRITAAELLKPRLPISSTT